MKLILKITPVLFFFMFSCGNAPEAETVQEIETEELVEEEISSLETLRILSADSILLKADYYKVKETTKPLILLFHQAQFSRGEYLEIGPKLNALGYSCIAIDQRSGKTVNGVDNDTEMQAVMKGLGIDYVDALPDLQATLDYVLEENLSEEVILWGSSYSSSLIFVLESKNPEHVVGLVSFSPGEYFTYEGKEIKDFAAETKSPVFITSAQDEEEYWSEIYAQINSEKVAFLPDFEGYHGSKALWEVHEGNEKYWQALEAFLGRY